MLGRTKEKIKKYTQPYIKGKNCESHCKIMPLKCQKILNTFSFVCFFDNFVSYFWQENGSLLFHLSSWTWFELIFSIFKKVFLIHVINNLLTLTVYLL